jgi:hypothetical protein
MELREAVTLGIALVGAILGILNTWRTFFHDRTRLNVTDVAVDGQCALDVVNGSKFSVAITEIGLVLGHSDRRRRLDEHEYRTEVGDSLPISIEPRNRLRVFLTRPPLFDPECASTTVVYAITADGRRFSGRGDALREPLKEAAKLRASGVNPIEDPAITAIKRKLFVDLGGSVDKAPCPHCKKLLVPGDVAGGEGDASIFGCRKCGGNLGNAFHYRMKALDA